MDRPVTTGHGPERVIALHGWFGSSQGWGELPALISSVASVAWVDFRGYGRRRDVQGVHSIREAAGDVLAAADLLGWDEFSLIGHSMGGVVASQVIADASARVRRLIAVTPVPPTGADLGDAYGFFQAASTDRQVRREIVATSVGYRRTDAFVDGIVEHSLSADRAAFGAYLDGWAKADIVVPPSAAERLPVFVIAGQFDGGLPVEFLRTAWVRAFPRAVVDVLPDSGHYPMYEQPTQLAARINRFLVDPGEA